MTRYVAFLVLAIAAAAHAETSQELFQQALVKERSEGDLRDAIRLYERAAESAGKDRALAAKSLVQAGECYRRLGAAESKKVFERVLREYADQKDAADAARARLDEGQPRTAAKGDRAVWSGHEVDLFGTVSPDGRYLTYVDWLKTGNLMVHDFRTGTNHALTKNVSYGQFGDATFSCISRDGRQVAFAWASKGGPSGLRIAPFQGTSMGESRGFLEGQESAEFGQCDWSPDGQWIALRVRRKDLSNQIAVLSVKAGTLRVLKTVNWPGPGRIVFSPDSRHIAYDLATDEVGKERHVYVMAVDGSAEREVIPHASRNAVMAWSGDAEQHLVFASNRTGRMDLWAVPMSGGKPQGAAKLVKSDVTTTWALGMASGALYVYKGGDSRYVQSASFDTNSGKVATSPGGFQRFVRSGGMPVWSRDGKLLAYRSCSSEDLCTIDVVSSATGDRRQLYPKMSYIGSLAWSQDGNSFLIDGTDKKGRRAMYRVDAQTGELSPDVIPRPGAIARWSRDEKKMYFRRDGGIVEIDLATRKERDVFRPRAPGNGVSMSFSPDGQSIAAVEYTAKTSTLFVMPVAGGEPRELVRAEGQHSINGFQLKWTPDGKSLVYPRTSDAGQQLWLTSVASGTSRKLDIDVTNWVFAGGFDLSPDGKSIAFVAEPGNKVGPEVWALENILPRSLANSR